jgi:tetratricopeptide (TPR) repeat protein
VDADVALARLGRSPSIRYRLAICGAAPSELVPLREADPRWTDTLLFEGRRQMAMRPIADVARAVELFAAAQQAFPASHAVTLALAAAQHALSEFTLSLGNYDAVLTTVPTHRDALLGRVTSLSYLTRYVDAVAAATRLIELGTWHLGDAYYWRAWNRYQLHQLPVAWEDVERATALLVNTAVYTLAGYIAYARTELDTAIDRFDRAYAMDKTNCEAVWFAGLVHVDQQGWSRAAPKFSTALTCFTAAAAEARSEIEGIPAATYAEALKTRRRAAAQKRLDTADHRAAQSAFNAAQCFLRLGQKGEAASHLDRAAAHPLLREKAATLKMAIDKLPG